MRRPLPFAVLLLVLAACAQAASQESFEARVIAIVDGDTIRVKVLNAPPYVVRLAAIDAPEKSQPFGDRSRQHLSSLVYDQTVRVDWSKKDGYGRLVGKVFVAPPGSCTALACRKTLDVNLAQIDAGFSWHYKQFESEQSQQDRLAYAYAEQHAREQKLGLWKDAHPVPPWDWRHAPTTPPLVKSDEGPVRKSRNNICHDPSMPTYRSVRSFTSFQTLAECVSSGGRLPKSPGG